MIDGLIKMENKNQNGELKTKMENQLNQNGKLNLKPKWRTKKTKMENQKPT